MRGGDRATQPQRSRANCSVFAWHFDSASSSSSPIAISSAVTARRATNTLANAKCIRLTFCLARLRKEQRNDSNCCAARCIVRGSINLIQLCCLRMRFQNCVPLSPFQLSAPIETFCARAHRAQTPGNRSRAQFTRRTEP